MTLRTPTDAVERAWARIDADRRDGIWITLVDRSHARAEAREVERRLREGAPQPLAGTTFAVKDNIDVAGLPTTAGCPAYSYRPDVDAPVVAELRAAGAIVIGKTNMDQFATGLVGTRSPYGICPNAHWPGLVAGGSSSGSAVAVATGMVDLALGTDTAGSGRVPAACNGIVGLKPTRGSVSATGVVPACRSLDTVSVLAGNIDDAATAIAVAWSTAPDPSDPWSRAPLAWHRRAVRRVGVPQRAQLDFDGDDGGPAAFDRALERLAAIGLDVHELDVSAFLAAGDLLYEGAFVAERYDAVGAFVDAHLGDVDPVVAQIISRAGRLRAWQTYRDRTELERLRVATAPTWSAVDALVVPSVPRVPTVAEVIADPIVRNSRLGTYTNFVNLLDLCALTMPLGEARNGAPPFSVTAIAPAWNDRRLIALGRRIMTGTLASPRSS